MAAMKFMTLVKIGLFLYLFDLLGMINGLKAETEDIDSFYATYFEQPCCTRGRHVRHHKGNSFIFFLQEN